MTPETRVGAVRVSWTGNGVAERHDRVAISRARGPGTIIMSLGSGRDPECSLPDLKPGDRLRVMAELEVTTDYNTAEAKAYPRGCAQTPYDYSPEVSATLILAAEGDSDQPLAGTRPIAAKTVAVSHEQHHHNFVFAGAELTIPERFRGRGAVNLLLAARHDAARADQCLLVGQNEPDGQPKTDMGGISVCRLRGQVRAPARKRETRLRTKSIKIHTSQARPAVVYSMPLSGLRAHEQMTIRAKVGATAAALSTRARLSARLFLADAAAQVAPNDGYASSLAANKGRITKRTGFNYLPRGKAIPTQKVGVLHVLKDQDPEKTVYLNAACDGGDPSKRARPADQLALTNDGFIEVLRYSPSLFG